MPHGRIHILAMVNETDREMTSGLDISGERG